MVQHYEYTAFGKARYQKESYAFRVTNRYTGQKIDEDTGLYFYGSRYYDPELARFIQADTIVPSSTTSQALNRYTYVNNNPLKFTDPTGHGWLGDFFKKFIGTIITVALNILFPGSGFLLQLAFAAIGSAVSTAVNGGTFASFAIGMGIGLAAGCISNAMGVSLFGKNNWGAFIKDPIGMVASGALQGSIMGAISSAVYGQDIWKGMAYGALGGVIGTSVAISTTVTLSFGASVIKDMSKFVLEKGIQAVHFVVQKTVEITRFIAKSAVDITRFIAKTAIDISPFALKVAAATWNSPNTAIGLGLGFTGVLLGADWPTWDATHDMICFGNSQMAFGNGVCLGNVAIGPDPTNSHAWTGPQGYLNHEGSHVPQGGILGPFYLPAHIIDKALNGLIFNTEGFGFFGGRLEWGPYNLDRKGHRPFGGYKK